MPTPLPPTPFAGRCAAIAFALTIAVAPIAEIAWSLARGERPAILDTATDLWHRTDARRTAIEERLHDASIVAHVALPHYQQWITRLVDAGNRKVAVAADDWLFLREDLEGAFCPGFFAPGRGGEAALAAITDFRDQLRERDVELLLVPVPGKEVADPERLSSRTRDVVAAPSARLEPFYARLEAAGIEFVRVDRLLAELRAADPERARYLARDVHWTPATMQAVAKLVAEHALPLLGALPEEGGRFTTAPARTIRAHGDLVRMLRVADPDALFEPMELALEPVLDVESNSPIGTDRDGEVLLLGDSFVKVFSDPALGLGEGAGLAEHLARALGQPIDVIALAGGATTAVRATLAQTSERLATKRLVIWEFAARTLAHDAEEWKPIELDAPAGRGDDVTPRLEVIARIVETTSIPPGFDYAFCLATHEYAVERVLAGAPSGERIWVAFPAIVDRVSTPARSFQPGLRHRLVLEPLRAHHDLDTTTWLDDTGVESTLWYPLEWRAAEDERPR